MTEATQQMAEAGTAIANYNFLVSNEDAQKLEELQVNAPGTNGLWPQESLHEIAFPFPGSNTAEKVIMKIYASDPKTEGNWLGYLLSYHRNGSLVTSSVMEEGPGCPYDRVWWPGATYSVGFDTAYDPGDTPVAGEVALADAEEDSVIVGVSPAEKLAAENDWEGRSFMANVPYNMTRNYTKALEEELNVSATGTFTVDAGDVLFSEMLPLIPDRLYVKITVRVSINSKITRNGRPHLYAESVAALCLRSSSNRGIVGTLDWMSFDLDEDSATPGRKMLRFDEADAYVHLNFSASVIRDYLEKKLEQSAAVLGLTVREEDTVILAGSEPAPPEVFYCSPKNMKAMYAFLREKGASAGDYPTVTSGDCPHEKQVEFPDQSSQYRDQLLHLNVITPVALPDSEKPEQLLEQLLDRFIVCRTLASDLTAAADLLIDRGDVDWLVEQLEVLALTRREARNSSK